MARLSKSAVEAFFVSGARPTQTQFEDLIDSYQDFSDFLQEMATALATKTGVVTVSGSATSAHPVLPLSLGGTGEASLASAQNTLNTGGFAVLASANEFTNENTFISSAIGSAENPAINLDRRATAVGGKNLGIIRFKGRDSLFASSTYAKIGGAIVSTSAGGETGRLQFTTIVSGASADRFMIAGGMYSLAASGGDRGIGTINVVDYFDDGEKVKNWSLLTSLDTSTGTSSETTAIPSTTSMIRLVFDGVSASGSDEIQVEIGATTYSSTSIGVIGQLAGMSPTEVPWTGSGPAQVTEANAGGTVWHGNIELIKNDNNNWTVSGILAGTVVRIAHTAGRIDLSAAMDRLKITLEGSDSFDAGNVHVWVYS